MRTWLRNTTPAERREALSLARDAFLEIARDIARRPRPNWPA